MRKIIDANCLETPILQQYLQGDPKNMAVLTEFAGMEVYKGDPVVNICNSMKILCQYPTQVIVLKGARQIIMENQTPSDADISSFIDEEQTKNFEQTCEVINEARKGNPLAITPILGHGKRSTEEMERLQKDAAKILEGIGAVIKTYNPDHLKILRKRSPITEELANRIIRDIVMIAALLIKGHPDTTLVPSARELKNTYILRFSLCGYLLVLDWIEKGGPYKVKLDRLRNDFIDMSYAAYATFCDGIISRDQKLTIVYQRALYFLETVFGA